MGNHGYRGSNLEPLLLTLLQVLVGSAIVDLPAPPLQRFVQFFSCSQGKDTTVCVWQYVCV